MIENAPLMAYFEIQASSNKVSISPILDAGKPVFLIGSDARCHLQLIDSALASVHAAVSRKDGDYFIKSQLPNLTMFVNGKAINQTTQLRSGDVVQIGQMSLRFDLAPASELASLPEISQAAANVSTEALPAAAAKPSSQTPPLSETNAYVLAVSLANKGHTRIEILNNLKKQGISQAAADQIVDRVITLRRKSEKRAALIQMVIGAIIFIVGLAITILTFNDAVNGGDRKWIIAWGAIVFGGLRFVTSASIYFEPPMTD